MNIEQKVKNVLKGRVVVYIDTANLESSVRDMSVRLQDKKRFYPTMRNPRWHMDYKELRLFFEHVCDLREIRFYSAEFKTESHIKFRSFLKNTLEYTLITKPLKEYKDNVSGIYRRKANFDVEIAVDTMCYTNDFDTFILFSGDSDFEYLIRFLRGKNKTVIGFSRSGHIAKELVSVLSYYFDIAHFRNIFMYVKDKVQ